MSARVLQLTDFHLTADPRGRLKNVPTRQALDDVLDFIRTSEIAFDFAILTGDLTHDGELASYHALRKLLGDWLSRCRLIPGNHDVRAAMRRAFPEIVPAGRGPLTFSCEIGGWLLLGLDSLRPGYESGRVEDAQLVWLQEKLSRHAGQPCILFVHHPPVPVGCAWLDQIRLEEPDGLIELVAASRQIKAVCCGHVHHEFEGRIGEAAVFATPSTAIQFGTVGDAPCYEASPPGFRLLELAANGLRSEVVRLPAVKYPPER